MMQLQLKQSNQSGFTLLELLIVIVIIGILSTIVVPGLTSGRDRARIAKGKDLAGYAVRIAGEEIAGKWELDEGSGTTASDSSGYGVNGTLTNGPTWSSDTYSNSGNSVLFDGSNDYITVPNSSFLNPSSGITFGTWFKANSLSGARSILSKTETGGYNLTMSTPSPCLTDYICGLVWINGAYRVASIPTSGLETGKWYYFLISYNGSTLKMYQDGEEVASTNITGSIGYSFGNPFCIGSEATNVGCTGGQYFNGNIDEVRVYGKGLIASEVRSLYTASLARLVSGMILQ